MRWFPIFVVPLAAIALAGCGGSNDASSNTTTTTTEPTTTTESTTTGSTTTTETTTTEAAGGLSGAFTSAKCRSLIAAYAKASQSIAAASGSNVNTAADELEALANAAPSEIRADVQTLADAVASYLDEIKGLDFQSGQVPSAADLQKLQSAAAAFNSQKVQAASQHVQAWTTKNCGG